MDFIGWVRVEDTIDYDESTIVKYEGDVSVKVGSLIIESYEFPVFVEGKANHSYHTYNHINGKIEEKREGYVRLIPEGLPNEICYYNIF